MSSTGQGALARAAVARDTDATTRPRAAFLALAGLVIVGAVAVRLALLERQSYWVDEIFSVNQSSGTFRRIWDMGATEVHTPLYAVLLWVWTGIGGTGEAWTRLLSTLFAVGAVAVAHRSLRSLGLGEHVRWALTAATAAAGMPVAYSLETRSYALLLLGSVGLTAATVRAGVDTLRGDQIERSTSASWAGWSALAATTHLFGAVLTLAALAVLVTAMAHRSLPRWPRRALRWAALAGGACTLQLGWLLAGLNRPGFASGTEWIPAPGLQDVQDLATSIFSSGGLTPHKDGFAWTSPLGAVVVVVGLVALGAATLIGRRAATAARPESPERQAATILLGLAAVVVLGTAAISQWIHLWTLRNMIVVVPAALWGVVCLAAALAPTPRHRRTVAAATVVLLGASLLPTSLGLTRPYKSDVRGLVRYLGAVQAGEPDTRIRVLAPVRIQDWRVAIGGILDDPAWDRLDRSIVVEPGTPVDAVQPSNDREVVIVYRGVSRPRPDEEVAILVERLGPGRCHSVPIYGFGVVRCG